MKIVTFCSIVTLACTLAFASAVALDLAILPLFAATATAFVFLTWAADYRGHRDYAACTSIALRRRQALPLAA